MDLVREPERTASGAGLLRGLRALGGLLLRQPRAFAVLAPLAWMGLIWFLSSQPAGRADEPSPLFSFIWNMAHGPEYAILAVLLLPLLPRRDGWVVLERAQMIFVMAVAGGYGVIDELHQGRVAGRASSVGDALTDLCAIGAVLVIARYVSTSAANGRGLARRLLTGAAVVTGGAAVATFEHLIHFSA